MTHRSCTVMVNNGVAFQVNEVFWKSALLKFAPFMNTVAKLNLLTLQLSSNDVKNFVGEITSSWVDNRGQCANLDILKLEDRG